MARFFIIAGFFFVLLNIVNAEISDDLIVQTQKGKIRGVGLKTATNQYVT